MDPSPQQFGPFAKRRVTHIHDLPGYEGDESTDTYKYSKEDPEAYTGWTQHQELMVVHKPPKYTHVLSTPHGTETQHDDWGADHRIDQANADLARGYTSGRPKLFGTGYDPGHSKVIYLAGSREGRPMTMTMLGIAQNDAWRYHGHERNLLPSENLSEHSAHLVGHMAERGIIPEEHVERGPGWGGKGNVAVSNDLTFQDYPQSHYQDEYEHQLSHSEVMAGRGTARHILRQGKPRGVMSSPQFEQGTLF